MEQGPVSIEEIKQLPIIVSVLARLRSELSEDLIYHSTEHTEDVLHEVLLFAHHDGLTTKEMILLAIAAAYHDAGFIEARFGNEGIGSRMALDAMRKAGNYTDEDMRIVRQCIDDTAIRVQGNFIGQKPTTKLSKYLLDADMSNLGRDDFFKKADQVAKERQTIDMTSFWKDTMNLLLSKDWYSPAAKTLRQPGWEKNIEALKKQIAAQ